MKAEGRRQGGEEVGGGARGASVFQQLGDDFGHVVVVARQERGVQRPVGEAHFLKLP